MTNKSLTAIIYAMEVNNARQKSDLHYIIDELVNTIANLCPEHTDVNKLTTKWEVVNGRYDVHQKEYSELLAELVAKLRER